MKDYVYLTVRYKDGDVQKFYCKKVKNRRLFARR